MDGAFFSDAQGTTNALWRAARRHMSISGLRNMPPIWRERRMALELAELIRHPISRGVGLSDGRGLPVFLIPGYLAGDVVFEPLARALRAARYRPQMSGVRLNVGCASTMFAPLESRLERHVAENGGRKAFLVGQSRGGGFARWLAVRRPDLVAGLATLGTPLRDPLALNPLLLVNLGFVGALGTMGVPGVLSTQCLRLDRCCAAVWRELSMPLDPSMPFLSVHSRSDGIVDWRACLDPAAHNVEVDSSHCGMVFNVGALRALGAALSDVVRTSGDSPR